MELESLYEQIILDHYRLRFGRGLREPFTAQAHHVNPSCGDEITLRVRLGEGPDPVLEDISYSADGCCSISQASMSVLAEQVTGEPLSAWRRRHEAFLEMMRGRGAVQPDEDVLGDAVAFAGVARLSNRVKCALLGWMALQDAIGQSLAAAASAEGNGS